MVNYCRQRSIYTVKKCTKKCTAQNDKDQDEGSGMEASEWSLGNEVSERNLGNEGLGMESWEWSAVIMTYRRMILPFEDMKELYI